MENDKMSKTERKIRDKYTSVIQNLLYKFPLYNYVNKDKVNILVVGYSAISEKLIDYAFEMAQVNGYKLKITVASDVADARNAGIGKPRYHNLETYKKKKKKQSKILNKL